MRPLPLRAAWPALLVAAAACSGPARSSPPPGDVVPDVAVTHPPYEAVHVAFKDRLEVPYAYLPHVGDYRLAGSRLEELARRLEERGLAPSGPPFALFYDDPGRVPVSELRARVAFPLSAPVASADADGPLRYDVLPAATVAYAIVSGPYPEVPRAYPGLYGYLEEMRWVDAGPVREVYLVPPGSVDDWDELRCEVQIPVENAE